MKNNQVAYVAGGIAIAAALIAGTFFYLNSTQPMLPYGNPAYGLSFEYPESYQLGEAEVGGRHVITLVDKAFLAASTTASEGPTSISVEIFPNTRNLTPSEWVKATPASNFVLSPDGTLASSTQAGKEAVAYLWDGLYRGESYVFSQRESIYMFSVTYMDTDDRIRRDFVRLLKSVQFTE